jgi:hypothetical protein
VKSFFLEKQSSSILIFLVGGILGGVFGALALIALLIVGYIFVLPRIRRARFESKISMKLISRFIVFIECLKLMHL